MSFYTTVRDDPVDLSDVKEAIYTWFSGASGITTIWEDQNAPAPALPYATLEISSQPTPIGSPDYTNETDLGQASGEEVLQSVVQTMCRMTIACSVYTAMNDSDGAQALLMKALAALDREAYREPLREANIGLGGVVGTQRLTGLIASRIEDRATADVQFYIQHYVQDRTGYIATVSFTENWT